MAATIARIALLVGLFTIAWDRFGNFTLIGYNVKLPTLAFAIALGAGAVALAVGRKMPAAVANNSTHWILAILAAIVGTLVVSSFLASEQRTAFLQTGAIVVGALFPFFTTWFYALSTGDVARPLWAFIGGGIFTAAFGVYQLIAAVAGLPQFIEYPDLGGGLPRISSFLYEAGYFGYYMILVIAACAAMYRLTQKTWLVTVIVALTLVTLVANTRASYLTLPILFALLLVTGSWRSRLASALRSRRVWIAILVSIAAALLLAFTVARPATMFLAERFRSIFDPSEPTSNSPRLELAQASLEVYVAHPIFGIGPGNLIYNLTDYLGKPLTDLSPNQVVANNAYIQALLDGGPLLLGSQLAFMILLAWVLFRAGSPAVSALASGWVTVAIIAFVGTSFFWDAKLWSVAGIALAMAGLTQTRSSAVRMEPQ